MTMTLPKSDVDPFSDEILNDPYPWYKELRALGPVVHLERYGVVALARFEDVRSALRDWKTFVSTAGVAFNDVLNQDVKDTVLCMEPPDHEAGRAVLNKYLKLSEIRAFTPLAERRAEELVSALVERGSFEAIGELVEPYVTSVVGELLGIPESLLDVFLEGSIAGFTIVGPMNERTTAALPILGKLFETMAQIKKDDMRPESIGWHILDSEERGEIPEAMRTQLLWNFMGPAFDTTINALGSTLWLLATHPGEWRALRADRSLIPAAINEGIRCESPIQNWSRFAPETATVDGSVIPGGTRVAVLVGAANRDERHYPDPDAFRIQRNPVDHLGFGHGIHLCVGAPLARLELTSVLQSLADHAATISLAAPPVRRLNNSTRGLDRLQLEVGRA